MSLQHSHQNLFKAIFDVTDADDMPHYAGMMELGVGMAETKREMDSDDSIEAEVPQEIVKLLTPPEAAEVGQLTCSARVTDKDNVRQCAFAKLAHVCSLSEGPGCYLQAEDAQLNGSNGAHVDVKSKAAA